MAKLLDDWVSQPRVSRIEAVLAQRTRRLTVVLEDLHDPHNCSACLRTADAVGLQDVHVIEGVNRFAPHRRVTQGCDKWLDIHRHPDAPSCAAHLKAAGYLILAACPDGELDLSELDVRRPLAVAFGGEHTGLSPALCAAADGRFRIPMRGFSQSLNVSVSVAVTLYHLLRDRLALYGPDGDLPPEQQQQLRRLWVYRSIKCRDRLPKQLLEEPQS